MARIPSKETRTRIMKSAKALFIKNGFQETSIQDIAKKANVSAGTVYTYFESKQDLLNSLNLTEEALIRPMFEKKKKRLLSEALILFGKKGYEGTTMDEIAAAVGLTKASLYQYCTSKEDLFSQVLQESALNTVTKEIQLTGNRDNWEAAITEIGLSYLKLSRTTERTALLQSILRDSIKFPEIGQLYFECGLKKACDNMALFLEDIKRAGLIKDVNLKLAASTYLGSLQSFIINRYVIHGIVDHVSDKEYFETATQLFISGLKK